MINTKNIQFAIDMTKACNNSTADFYKRVIIKMAKDLGLTVAATGVNVRRGLEFAGYGNVLTVGTVFEKTGIDMEWIERPGFACEKGYKPVYDIIDDYNTIKAKLHEYASNKSIKYFTSGGDVAEMQIGSDVVVLNGKVHLRKRDIKDIATLLGVKVR